MIFNTLVIPRTLPCIEIIGRGDRSVKIIMREKKSFAKNYIDRYISLAKNVIDREGQL